MSCKGKPTVLITGGSGLIGRYLTPVLLSRNFTVNHLSRHNKAGNNGVFSWNPEKKLIDPASLEGVDYIIHLAGANLGESRWTPKRKKEITGSRIDSANMLFDEVQKRSISLKGFITASGISLYGTLAGDRIFKETDPPAKDFLGELCRKWELAADRFAERGIRTVKIRTAVVLEKADSALSKMMMPSKFGFLGAVGTGKQYMPWIHINDIRDIYLKAIEDENMTGAYNAVAPQHVTHEEFIRTLGRVMKKPVMPVPVPGFLLKVAMGEMAGMVLEGSRVSSAKIRNAGYSFAFPELYEALEDVLK